MSNDTCFIKLLTGPKNHDAEVCKNVYCILAKIATMTEFWCCGYNVNSICFNNKFISSRVYGIDDNVHGCCP